MLDEKYGVRNSTLATFVLVVTDPAHLVPDAIVRLDSQTFAISGGACGARTGAATRAGCVDATLTFGGTAARRGAHAATSSASSAALQERKKAR